MVKSEDKYALASRAVKKLDALDAKLEQKRQKADDWYDAERLKVLGELPDGVLKLLVNDGQVSPDERPAQDLAEEVGEE